jgi:hypothetical protein
LPRRSRIFRRGQRPRNHRCAAGFPGGEPLHRNVMRHAPGIGALEIEPVRPLGEHRTMGREVYPDGRRASVNRVHCDYAFPAYYITEHRAAFPDPAATGGAVHDARRIADLHGDVAPAGQALRERLPSRGCFIWSLIDHFEWSHSYTQRFASCISTTRPLRGWGRTARAGASSCCGGQRRAARDNRKAGDATTGPPARSRVCAAAPKQVLQVGREPRSFPPGPELRSRIDPQPGPRWAWT